MTLKELIDTVKAKVEHYTKAWESGDPKQMFLGTRLVEYQGKDGKSHTKSYTTTAKDVAWRWKDRLETLEAIAEKRLPKYLLPKPATASANTLIEQVKALSEADKKALLDALKGSK